jgi:hypothetical protein
MHIELARAENIGDLDVANFVGVLEQVHVWQLTRYRFVLTGHGRSSTHYIRAIRIVAVVVVVVVVCETMKNVAKIARLLHVTFGIYVSQKCMRIVQYLVHFGALVVYEMNDDLDGTCVVRLNGYVVEDLSRLGELVVKRGEKVFAIEKLTE